MTIFDAYIMVDWSASNEPTRGKDSIWIAESVTGRGSVPLNVSTRLEAEKYIFARINEFLEQGARVCVGFDFAFGYPAGASEIIFGAASWKAAWTTLSKAIKEHARNKSNRFLVAEALNRTVQGEGPFWGVPWQHVRNFQDLDPKKPKNFGCIPEFRHAEKWSKSAKSVWQLCYNGAVGSQTLLGIAMLYRLRQALTVETRVWPFETLFTENLPAGPSVTFVEIYPSLFPISSLPAEVRDASQVRCVADAFFAMDSADKLLQFLSSPKQLNINARNDILREEGWIAGLGQEALLA